MTNSRHHLLALVAIPLLLALSACGPGTPTPGWTGGASSSPTPSASSSATPDPTASGEPSAEPEAERDVTVAVNSSLIAVYAVDDGERIASVSFTEGDHAAAAARIAAALGEDPVVTTTASTGSGCDSDQTIYDFGGFFLRSPGFVGTVGLIEVEVDGAATSGGVPIFTIGGAQVGMSLAAFEGAVGPVIDLGTFGTSTWLGFDQSNPGVADYDAIGSLARFNSGVLTHINAPYYFYGDC